MNNIEYAWVIQRDDRMFYHQDSFGWVENCFSARMYWTVDFANYIIKRRQLQNCKPVKIKIEVVEDE